MKKFLFLFLLVYGSARGQNTFFFFKSAGPSYYFIDGVNIKWPVKSDTIEILLPLKIHFIKIGNEVYQIVEHPATIEKVEKSNIYWQPGMRIIPNWYGPDTLNAEEWRSFIAPVNQK